MLVIATRNFDTCVFSIVCYYCRGDLWYCDVDRLIRIDKSRRIDHTVLSERGGISAFTAHCGSFRNFTFVTETSCYLFVRWRHSYFSNAWFSMVICCWNTSVLPYSEGVKISWDAIESSSNFGYDNASVYAPFVLWWNIFSAPCAKNYRLWWLISSSILADQTRMQFAKRATTQD